MTELSWRGMSRWGMALGVAALIAIWPACSSGPQPPTGDAKVANLAFTIKDMNGREVNLAETYKGKALLINFWATWCTPCKYEIPMLVELQEKYRDQNFVVLGISTDDPPGDELRKFAAEFKMNYPVLSALGHDELQEAYDASMTIPISWFVRADGSVLLSHMGVQTKDWFEKRVKQIVSPAVSALETSRD